MGLFKRLSRLDGSQGWTKVRARTRKVKRGAIQVEFKILRKSVEKRRVYGWASVIETKEGKPIVDRQNDVIFPDDLDDAAADFVKYFRQGGEMHTGGAPNGLVASMVFTKELQEAIGIPPGTLPVGWLVGFEVPQATFEKVKDGSRLMFSIEGEADREAIAL